MGSNYMENVIYPLMIMQFPWHPGAHVADPRFHLTLRPRIPSIVSDFILSGYLTNVGAP